MQGQRLGRILKATATTVLRFGDFGLERPRVAIVLSVRDEIRLEIALTAVRSDGGWHHRCGASAPP